MIARVRIAPVEQWCDGLKTLCGNDDPMISLVGMPISIHTESLTVSRWCGGKTWIIEEKSAKQLRAEGGRPKADSYPRFACEHMLEMD
jgi:hypothetical protein